MKYAKHVHVLELLNSIPRRPFDAFQECDTVGITRPIVTPEEAVAAWDHLFTYIHENWQSPTAHDRGYHSWRDDIPESVKVNMFDCKAALNMSASEIEEKLEQLPPFFSETIFPVAVARFLLRELAMPFNHRKSRTFTEFHNRYGALILSY